MSKIPGGNPVLKTLQPLLQPYKYQTESSTTQQQQQQQPAARAPTPEDRLLRQSTSVLACTRAKVANLTPINSRASFPKTSSGPVDINAFSYFGTSVASLISFWPPLCSCISLRIYVYIHIHISGSTSTIALSIYLYLSFFIYFIYLYLSTFHMNYHGIGISMHSNSL